jgi:hypothetical protein
MRKATLFPVDIPSRLGRHSPPVSLGTGLCLAAGLSSLLWVLVVLAAKALL